MKLKEAEQIINQITNKSFGTLIQDENEFSDIVKNKGKAGQILERIILHLNLSTKLQDFEDGELKTNKCDKNGNPLETIAITQIKSDIDNLINQQPFEESHLAQKIYNLLYVPIVREGDSHNQMFLDSINIDFYNDKYTTIWTQIKEDYQTICSKIKKDIETTGYISTSNGKFIQIRTKDSAPYHPIYTQIYQKEISNKNYAFYFKKDFIQAIRKIK